MYKRYQCYTAAISAWRHLRLSSRRHSVPVWQYRSLQQTRRCYCWRLFIWASIYVNFTVANNNEEKANKTIECHGRSSRSLKCDNGRCYYRRNVYTMSPGVSGSQIMQGCSPPTQPHFAQVLCMCSYEMQLYCRTCLTSLAKLWLFTLWMLTWWILCVSRLSLLKRNTICNACAGV